MRKWIFAVLTIICAVGLMSFKSTYKKLWANVEAAQEEGLPQTQKKWLTEILKKAQKDNELGEYFKAYIVYDDVVDTLGERSFEQSIDLLEQWLDKSSKEVEQAMVHQLLFQAYSTYFFNNTRQFYKRTDVTTNDTLTDIRFWSASQFKERIAYHLYSTFDNEELLITKSSKDLSPFTTVNPFGKYFNHDLFHVLYWQTLKKVELLPLVVADKEEMLVALHNKALKLYENNREAQLLLRLHFIDRQSFFKKPQEHLVETNSEKVFIRELDNLIEEFYNTNVVVEALLKKALYLNMSDSTKLQAHKLCEAALEKHPTYERIDAVKLLKQQIEKPLISLDALEHSYPGKKIVNSIDYRNVSELTISIYGLKDYSIIPHDTLLTQEFCNNSTYLIDQLKIDTLSTLDYITHSLENIPFTIDKEGCYLIELSSPEAKKPDYAWHYSTKGQIIGRAIDFKTFEFIVVDGLSGHPIENATITIKDNEKNKVKELISTSTGRAVWSIPSDYKSYGINVYVTKENKILVPSVNFYLRSYNRNNDKKEVDYQGRLLSDRSIYKPGQTVHLKGYTFVDSAEGAKPVNNFKDTVSVYSPSGVVLAEKAVVSNEFGTYSVLIDLPEASLNGRYSIRSKRSRAGAFIQVEEYKRPTFAIELNPIEGRYKSGDTVTVTGKVEAFNQAMLKGAVLKIDASVNNFSYPIYYRERFSKGELVLFDQLNLADDGLFIVHIPLPEEDSYWSYLSLEVSVTSLSGETQKIEKGIDYTKESFGLTSSFASILEKDQEIDLSVSAVNSDGQAVEVEGYYELFEAVGDESDAENKGDLILKETFKANQPLLVDWSNLDSGEYLLKCNGKDGEEMVVFTRRITLFSTTDKSTPVKAGDWLYVKKNTFNEESPALFNYGTADDSVYVYIDLFTEDGRLLKKERLHMKEMNFIEFPYKKEYGKGVSISLIYFKDALLKHRTLNLKYEKQESDLKLKWSVFRNSLIPGMEEEWSLSVFDKDNQPVNAEVLAYMYDASLNQLSSKTNTLSFADNFYINAPYPNLGLTGFLSLKLSFASEDIKTVPSLLYDEFDTWSRVTYEHPFYIRGLASSKSSGEFHHVQAQILDSSVSPEVQEEASFNSVKEKPDFVRDNFDETAFFYPHLRSNKEGNVTLNFKVPQQLTKWSFNAIAHSQDMQVGSLIEEVLTEQDFSISLNTPRIVRQGDKLTLNSILQNHKKTETDLEVSVTLTLFDPLTDKVISEESKAIKIGAESEELVPFTVKLDTDIESIGCRLVAENEEFSDGEQFIIPVLSNKVKVVEAKTLLLNDKTDTNFDINSLLNKNKANSLSGTISLEITSNPLWFAINPLVEMNSKKTDNSLALANKVWATITANSIAEEFPLSKDSVLAANVLNEYIESKGGKRYQSVSETPWAKHEIDRANQLNLFRELVCSSDLKFSVESMVTDLLSQQQSNGGWSWYEGFKSDVTVTKEVLSVLDLVSTHKWYENNTAIESAKINALSFILTENMNLKNKLKSKETVTESELKLLMLLQNNKTFYSNVESKEKEYIDDLKNRINKLRPKGSIRERALIALIHKKEGNDKSASRFVSSLKESLLFDKYGAHYNFTKQGVQWGSTYQTESHLLAMKAISEIELDTSVLNQMKLWLMHKVQTKSSLPAFIEKQVLEALLAYNTKIKGDTSVVNIGKYELVLDSTTPYLIKNIDLDTNQTLSILKEGTSPLWVNVSVTYEENIEEVQQSADELSITKEYYVEKVEGKNKTLIPLKDISQLSLGDIVVSRLSFSLDTDLDFIHIQDDRSAVLEPMEHLSGPRYRPLGCIGISNMYQSITDKSTNYYFYKLQKGGYVIENRSYVVREGVVESGISSIQSSYAPEFTAHSSSVKLIIK